MNRQDEEIILPKNDTIYNYFQTIYPQKVHWPQTKEQYFI